MSKLGEWWAYNFLLGESILCLVASIAIGWWALFGGGIGVIESNLGPVRPTFYSTLASLFGSLFGFGITAASIIAALVEGGRFESLRRNRNYPALWKTLMQTVVALAVASAFSVVGLLVDHGQSPGSGILLVLVFFTLLSVARLGRTIWLLGLILQATSAEPGKRVASNPPKGRTESQDMGADPADSESPP